MALPIVHGLKLAPGLQPAISGVHFMQKGHGAVEGSAKAGYYVDSDISDCLFTGDPDLPDQAQGLDWGERMYNLRGTTVRRRNKGRNIPREHMHYWGSFDNGIIEDEEAQDIGSQWAQFAMREYESYAGMADNRPGLLSVRNIKLRRCATETGRRPSWNFCFYAAVMQARDVNGNLVFNAKGQPVRGVEVPDKHDIEMSGLDWVGNDFPHSASGRPDCQSTGAILVQDGPSFYLDRSSFIYVKPYREIIQIRNRKDVVIKPITLIGGDLVLHDMDDNRVRIAAGLGNGTIRRRVLGSHKSTFLANITDGYSH